MQDTYTNWSFYLKNNMMINAICQWDFFCFISDAELLTIHLSPQVAVGTSNPSDGVSDLLSLSDSWARQYYAFSYICEIGATD